MPHFFASKLRAVALPARTKNFEFIFEAKSVRDESTIIFAKSLAKSLHGEQKILLSKQKKGERLLVKFNKHFAPHSKEIIKSALKEYAELAGAEIASHNLNENKIKVDSAYLLDWRGICAHLGGNSSLDLHSADFANLGRLAQTSSLALRPKFAKNHESQTENPSVLDSAQIAESKKELCEAPENSPASWCKKSGEASSSASADFLLEAEKRGSPPKSEKRQLLARRESGERGAALLREESNEIDENNEKVAESSVDSADSTLSTQEANSSIFDEKSGLCSCERGNRTNGSLTKRATNLPDLSQKDAGFACLEIGFGSGRHILHLAQKHPNARIIGLEIYRPAISQVLRQIEILGLQNLYVASLDARVLCEVLPVKCLDRIYLHFPVPWLKNPQRRVLSAQFLGNAMRALKDDGFFELLTDSAEYFAFAKALAGDYKFVAEEGAKGEVVSKYEARWRRQEKVIYKLCIYPVCGNSVLGMQFRTKNAESSADSATRTLFSPLNLLSFSQKGCTPHPAPPTRQKLRFSLLGGEPRFSASSKKSALALLLASPDFLHHEAGEFSGASHEFNVDSANPQNSQNLVKNKSREAQPLKSVVGGGGGSCEGGGGERLRNSQESLHSSPRPLPQKNARGEKWDSNADLSAQRREKIDSANRTKIAESKRDSSPMAQNDKIMDCNADFANLLAMTDFNGLPHSHSLACNDEFIRDSSPTAQNDNFGGKVAESTLDSANPTPFSPTKICKKEYFLHIKNKYIFEGGVVLFASFGAYYAPSSAYFVICGDCVYTISEIIPTSANIDAVELFMELCFDN